MHAPIAAPDVCHVSLQGRGRLWIFPRSRAQISLWQTWHSYLAKSRRRWTSIKGHPMLETSNPKPWAEKTHAPMQAEVTANSMELPIKLLPGPGRISAAWQRLRESSQRLTVRLGRFDSEGRCFRRSSQGNSKATSKRSSGSRQVHLGHETRESGSIASQSERWRVVGGD